MRNRKFTFILCMALAAAVALFGVTEAKAFTGWTVVTDNNAFDKEFTYTFTNNGGDKISFVEILVTKDLNIEGGVPSINPAWPYENIETYVDGFVTPYEFISGPTGDGGTALGIGLPDKDLIKIKSDSARSFPSDRFTLKIVVQGDQPPPEDNFVLGDDSIVMLMKSGNGQNWESDNIGGPGFAAIPPLPPPVSEDESFISVEGHEGFLINVQKDPFGNYLKVCLVHSGNKAVVIDNTSGLACCTEVGEFTCTPKEGATPGADPIVLNIGDFGDTVVMCSGGPLDNPTGCSFVTYAADEATLKGGNTTSVWRFFYGRWIKVCLDSAC